MCCARSGFRPPDRPSRRPAPGPPGRSCAARPAVAPFRPVRPRARTRLLRPPQPSPAGASARLPQPAHHSAGTGGSRVATVAPLPQAVPAWPGSPLCSFWSGPAHPACRAPQCPFPPRSAAARTGRSVSWPHSLCSPMLVHSSSPQSCSALSPRTPGTPGTYAPLQRLLAVIGRRSRRWGFELGRFLRHLALAGSRAEYAHSAPVA